MAKRDVVQYVSEARRAWGLRTADGALPTENGRYMNTDTGAVVAVLSYCLSAVKVAAEVNNGVCTRGVKERQARWSARGQAQDTPSANGRRRVKERREGQRSASVYVFVCRTHGAEGARELMASRVGGPSLLPCASGCSRPALRFPLASCAYLRLIPVLHPAGLGNALACSCRCSTLKTAQP
jgi:hypothetical protein